tara:strand:- start:8854 stop:11016 length:2163 start_codon:yes stop_codon:yes gene_type:complete
MKYVANETKGTRDQVSASLLQTILTDSDLRDRLGVMPADEKTVALSVDGDASTFSHPGWEQAIGLRPKLDSDETVELSADAMAQLQGVAAEGFVPQRRVANLGEGKTDAAEYRLVGKLGSGGTGIVYQAHQRAVDREVAIKVLRDELARDPVSRSRFLTEARMIGGLDHPNVIALHELSVDDRGGLFYSMKRIDGTSWDQQIADMSLSKNLQTLRSVADAIRYAHSRRLIHRDIKPENVMLGKFGEVLLADWGLAISYSERDDSVNKITAETAIGGTPAYMAPELAAGDFRAVGFHTDVYLLGAVLFQVLTGYPPHYGESLLACIHAAANNEIRPTRVEGELMDIAMKAMATDPRQRYGSVDDFVSALDDQRQHEQSNRLVRRARERLEESTEEKRYEDFRVADTLLRESLDLWPENPRAKPLMSQLYLDFARAATAQGDFDLALSMYDAAGQSDSEAAARIRRQRDERQSSQERVSKYSRLFSQLPEAGLLGDTKSGTIVEANEMFEKVFGFANEDIVGTKLGDLNLWACEQRRVDFVKQLTETGRVENFEAPFITRDGRRIEALISSRQTTINGEEMVLSTLRDISARKQAENELKRSRQRLREIQELAGIGTWSYDVRTGEVQWSDEAFRLAGRSPADGVPTREEYIEQIHPEDRSKMNVSIQRAIKDGAAYEIRVRQRGATDAYQELIMRGQPILDDDGKTVEVYGVLIRTDFAAR